VIDHVLYQDQLLAIIIPRDYRSEGIQFFTPNELSQQLAYMNHPKGKMIEPHVHNPVLREVVYTQEVLFVRKGKVRIDFFDEEHCLIDIRTLYAGDTVLLVSGGHGFTMLEDTEIIEVKQGPYLGDQDKTRFTPKSDR
jgi:hypothetical protein